MTGGAPHLGVDVAHDGPIARLDNRLSTHQHGSPLNAWDAADRALLTVLPAAPQRLIVIGARWGALIASLAPRVRSAVVDSAAGAHAIDENLALLAPGARPTELLREVEIGEFPPSSAPSFAPSFAPGTPQPGIHDGVILRASPAVALFAWHLSRLREWAVPGTPVWIAGPATTWSPGHTRALTAHFGADISVRGIGKARVATGLLPDDPSCSPPPREAPPPRQRVLPWTAVAGPTGFELVSLPGVFSHGRIDPGARALIAALPAHMAGRRVVDLGCGNGILGTEAARRGAADVVFTDDSARALASAQQTWLRAAGHHAAVANAAARYAHADAGANLPAGSADLVLCNPPFHQGKAQTVHIVEAMLLASRRILRPGGTLLLVGNRHLHHESRATSVLAGVRVMVDDGRFSVLRARR